MVKTTISILLVTILGVSACTFNSTYINREADNNEGKVFLKRFYANVAHNNYQGLDDMVGDSLRQLAGPHGLGELVKRINSKVGSYKGYTIDDQYIRCTTGGNNETSYNYKLKVTYEKGTVDEIIGFKKQNGSEIKLNSYHANSDLLMK